MEELPTNCLFCCKKLSLPKIPKYSDNFPVDLQHRFLKSLEKAFRSYPIYETSIGGKGCIGGNNETWGKLFGGALGARLSCEECGKIQIAFCDLLHRARLLELEALLQLFKLAEVIQAANQEDKEPWEKSKDATRNLLEARKQLVIMCRELERNTFLPKIIMRRCDFSTNYDLEGGANLINFHSESEPLSPAHSSLLENFISNTAQCGNSIDSEMISSSGDLETTDRLTCIKNQNEDEGVFASDLIASNLNVNDNKPIVTTVTIDSDNHDLIDDASGVESRLRVLYRCSECGKTFPSNQLLHSHQETHLETELIIPETEKEEAADDGRSVGDEDFEESSSSSSSSSQFSETSSDEDDEPQINIRKRKRNSTNKSRILVTNSGPVPDRLSLLSKLDEKTLHLPLDEDGLTQVEVHDRELILACEECGLRFETREELDRHKSKHYYTQAQRFPLKCNAEACFKRFETEDDLSRHNSVVHGDKVENVKVTEGASVKEEESLVFRCGDCDKSFANETQKLACREEELRRQPVVKRGLQLNQKKKEKAAVHPKRRKFELRLMEEKEVDDNVFGDGMESDDSDETGSSISSSESSDESSSSDEVELKVETKMAAKVENKTGESKRFTVKRKPALKPSKQPKKLRSKFICKVSGCKQWPFELEEELKNHSTWHGEFSCEQCGKVETYAPDLAIHEATAHLSYVKDGNPKKNFSCIRCAYSSNLRGSLVAHHLKTHLFLPTATIICPICRKGFTSYLRYPGYRPSSRDCLVDHLARTHDISGMAESAVSRCDHDGCSAYFKTVTQLQEHKSLVHSAVPKCDDCGKEFRSKGQGWKSLTRHRIKVHKKGKDFEFECGTKECGRKFETKLELERHEKFNHRNKGKFRTCPECGKICISASGFRSHLASHQRTEEDRKAAKNKILYWCELCGQGSRSPDLLKLHKLSHSGPESWEFSCEECGKKCLNKPKLAEHMQTHSKEVPFVCQVCGKGYRHRHNLRIHVNSKHGDVVRDEAKPVRKQCY